MRFPHLSLQHKKFNLEEATEQRIQDFPLLERIDHPSLLYECIFAEEMSAFQYTTKHGPRATKYWSPFPTNCKRVLEGLTTVQHERYLFQ